MSFVKKLLASGEDVEGFKEVIYDLQRICEELNAEYGGVELSFDLGMCTDGSIGIYAVVQRVRIQCFNILVEEGYPFDVLDLSQPILRLNKLPIFTVVDREGLENFIVRNKSITLKLLLRGLSILHGKIRDTEPKAGRPY